MREELFDWEPPASGESPGSSEQRVHSERVFLGWDQPMVHLATDWLWQHKEIFPKCLVITPTRESSRRLREQLAQRGGYLSPRFMTAGQFAANYWSAHKPHVLLERRGWIAVFQAFRWQQWESTFPPPSGEGWEERLAEVLMEVRQELAEYELGGAEVLASLAELHPDRARWELYYELEKAFFAVLRGWGVLQDLLPGKGALGLEGFEEKEEPQLIFAGVTDPSHWAVRAVRAHCTKQNPLTVLVNAPPSREADFDLLGGPLTSAWEDERLDWEGVDQRGTEEERGEKAGGLYLATNPSALAEQVVNTVRDHRDRPLALGLGDQNLYGPLESAFQKEGIKLYDPAGLSLRTSAFCQWLRRWRSFVQSMSLSDLLALVSSQFTARLIAHESPDYHCDPYQSASALQRLLSESTAQRVDDLWYLRKAGWPQNPRSTREKRALSEVLDLLTQLRSPLRACRSTLTLEALEDLLKLLLTGEDDTFGTAVMSEYQHLASQVTRLPTAEQETLDLLRELSSALDTQRLPSEVGEVHLEASGWLELGYESAEVLLLCSVNEGFIPNTQRSNPWMPESLRTTLGLRTSRDRHAHDVFYARTLLEARRTKGTVCVFFSQYGAGGDPLMPSRLLMQCSPSQLAERVKHCFSSEPYALKSPPWHREWVLKAPSVPAKTRISVTALKDYLTCPLRYYLKHVLKMQRPRESSADSPEWDHRAFGTMLHEVFEAMQFDPPILQTTDQKELLDWLWEKLDEVTARQTAHLPLVLSIQHSAMRQRLRFFAEMEVETRLEEGGQWQSVAWEEPFELEIGGVMIRGTIDRVDQHADGRYRLIDYKTGQVSSPEREHLGTLTHLPEHLVESPVILQHAGKEKYWQNLQLPLYALAYHAKTGAYPELLYCHLAESREKTQYLGWTFGEELGRSAREAAEYLVSQIQKKAFSPAATREKREYDDYRELSYGYPLSDGITLTDKDQSDAE